MNIHEISEQDNYALVVIYSRIADIIESISKTGMPYEVALGLLQNQESAGQLRRIIEVSKQCESILD